MGRGKVELKRIENKINRQVTFAKRRNGLLKKAYELSILCDAEVALIIFSNRGKLYEFCSSSSMAKTLEKYQKCSYGALETTCSIHEMQNNYQEYLRLKARVEVLQKSQRNLLGEDLAPLDSKELQQLEHQLENSLKLIRSTKTQVMLDQLADLQNKEQILLETNKGLRRKLDELNTPPRVPLRIAWEGDNHNNISYCRMMQPQPSALSPHPEGFLQPLEANSTLQIGYSPIGGDDVGGVGAAPTCNHNVNGFIPGWML
ncbi:hypothetical protein MLD38_021800 [Melastoma candidum]|uniref:Uncharacterized protein n=1 Tax=Melastoma candidum TaxID=119954 RepID=A0ACB9QHB9_9MYRT|nr:hypothetical protein MLD38_021800 [Melastoma candidum]